MERPALFLQVFTQPVRHGQDVTQGRNYGTSCEDRTRYSVVMDLRDQPTNHYTKIGRPALLLQVFTQPVRHGQDVTQGRNYGTSCEDRTRYSVVMDLRDQPTNHYTKIGRPALLLQVFTQPVRPGQDVTQGRNYGTSCEDRTRYSVVMDLRDQPTNHYTKIGRPALLLQVFTQPVRHGQDVTQGRNYGTSCEDRTRYSVVMDLRDQPTNHYTKIGRPALLLQVFTQPVRHGQDVTQGRNYGTSCEDRTRYSVVMDMRDQPTNHYTKIGRPALLLQVFTQPVRHGQDVTQGRNYGTSCEDRTRYSVVMDLRDQPTNHYTKIGRPALLLQVFTQPVRHGQDVTQGRNYGTSCEDRTRYSVVMDLRDQPTNHYTTMRHTALLLQVFTQPVRHGQDVTQVCKYGASSENRSRYSVVMDLQEQLANDYTTMGHPYFSYSLVCVYINKDK